MGARHAGLAGQHRIDLHDGTNAVGLSSLPGTVGNAHATVPHRLMLHGIVLGHRRTNAAGRGPHATGEGQVWKVSRSPYVGLLYAFGIGRAELGSAHEWYLQQTANEVRQRARSAWKLRIEGRASRTGSAATNTSLSRARAYAVHAFFIDKLGSLPVETDWVGEELAADAGEPDGMENLFFRSVLLSLWEADQPPPPPPPPPPDEHPTPVKKPDPEKKDFLIRVLGGHSEALSSPFLKTLSAGLDNLTIQIVDVDRKRICTYRYRGRSVGLGVSLSPLGPVSGVIYGGGHDWKKVKVPKDWTLEGIGGGAELHGMGVDSGMLLAKGQSGFSFSHHSSRWAIFSTRVTVSDIDLGETIGTASAGGSASDGSFMPVGEPSDWNGK